MARIPISATFDISGGEVILKETEYAEVEAEVYENYWKGIADRIQRMQTEKA